MAKRTRRRVYLFITRRHGSSGQVLLCGDETPGGTVEPGETPHEAALREATEETGLTALGPASLLAEDGHENADEILSRSFFHLPSLADAPDAWVHIGSGAGDDAGNDFHLRWVDLPDAEGLHPHFRAYLDRLVVWPAGSLPDPKALS